MWLPPFMRRIRPWVGDHAGAAAQYARRISCIDGPGLKIGKGNRRRTEHRALTHTDAGANRGPGSNPGFGVDIDGPGDDREIRAIDIMRGGEQMHVLRDDGSMADANAGLAVEHGVPANDRLIVKHQIGGYQIFALPWMRTPCPTLAPNMRRRLQRQRWSGAGVQAASSVQVTIQRARKSRWRSG